MLVNAARKPRCCSLGYRIILARIPAHYRLGLRGCSSCSDRGRCYEIWIDIRCEYTNVSGFDKFFATLSWFLFFFLVCARIFLLHGKFGILNTFLPFGLFCFASLFYFSFHIRNLQFVSPVYWATSCLTSHNLWGVHMWRQARDWRRCFMSWRAPQSHLSSFLSSKSHLIRLDFIAATSVLIRSTSSSH